MAAKKADAPQSERIVKALTARKSPLRDQAVSVFLDFVLDHTPDSETRATDGRVLLGCTGRRRCNLGVQAFRHRAPARGRGCCRP